MKLVTVYQWVLFPYISRRASLIRIRAVMVPTNPLIPISQNWK